MRLEAVGGQMGERMDCKLMAAAMAAKQQQGEPVQGAEAVLSGRGNQYPPGPGIPELRRAVAAHQERFYGLLWDPDSEVLVTAAATEGPPRKSISWQP